MLHQSLKFSRMPGTYAVCQLSKGTPIPAWAFSAVFVSITRTEEELSIVCDRKSVPADIKREQPWTALQLHGPFPFDQAGVLVSFIGPLAARSIPIFTISTYDTDYVFVKQEVAERAIEALTEAGHDLV